MRGGGGAAAATAAYPRRGGRRIGWLACIRRRSERSRARRIKRAFDPDDMLNPGKIFAY